jgi:AcrR family transcriptional regulator
MLMAALDAFTDEGFEQATVAGIAARAGVTERTFFRHFADKREVLFEGSDLLEEVVTGAVAAAPAGLPPVELVTSAFEALGPFFAERQEFARRRLAVISANASLLERELLKLHSLKSATADALRARGLPDPDAVLTAEFGGTIFQVGFQRWMNDPAAADIAAHIRRTSTELTALVARDRAG